MEQEAVGKQIDEKAKEHWFARGVGWLVASVCLVWLGWIAHEMMPPPAKEGGAQPGAAGAGGAPLVMVQVAEAMALNPPREYIGHVEPIQNVELRAQIEGYVKEIHFAEGAMVKAGDLLFTIDPERYEARVALRQAEIGQAEAELDRAERYLKRLEVSDVRAITQTDMDKARSDVAQGRAGVKQAKANLTLAEIDLKHTKIFAPIAGQVGRTVANVGDYVSPALGTLLRIVQIDPVRVVFSVTDRDYIHLIENTDGRVDKSALRIRLRLPTGTIPDIEGVRDFENNMMSEDTATLPILARFDNTKGLLIPGGYVTVLTDQPNMKKYPVVRQSALMADKEGGTIFTVDADGVAQLKRVTAGVSHNGRVEITSGLEPGERVIIEGVQKARSGQPVQIKNAEEAKQ